METKLFVTRLKTSLEGLTWPSSAVKVFGKVIVTPYFRAENVADFLQSTCFIILGGGEAYSEYDELFVQKFSVNYFVRNKNDRYNESSMLGSGRGGSTITSLGAGILDLDKVVNEHMRAITTLTEKISFKNISHPQVVKIKGNNIAILRAQKYTVTLSTDTSANDKHSEILRSPGRLFWNPTDIPNDAFGDFMGYVEEGVLFNPRYDIEPVFEEDLGEEVADYIFLGSNPKVVADVINYNSTSIARSFPGMTTGTQIQMPNAVKSGDVYSQNSGVFGALLFVPDDETNNFVFLLKKCVPNLDDNLILSRKKDSRFRLSFVSVRKSTSAQSLFYLGPKANVTLN